MCIGGIENLRRISKPELDLISKSEKCRDVEAFGVSDCDKSVGLRYAVTSLLAVPKVVEITCDTTSSQARSIFHLSRSKSRFLYQLLTDGIIEYKHPNAAAMIHGGEYNASQIANQSLKTQLPCRLSIHHSFIPSALCTLIACLILRSSIISSLPPGIAYALTSLYSRSTFAPWPPRE